MLQLHDTPIRLYFIFPNVFDSNKPSHKIITAVCGTHNSGWIFCLSCWKHGKWYTNICIKVALLFMQASHVNETITAIAVAENCHHHSRCSYSVVYLFWLGMHAILCQSYYNNCITEFQGVLYWRICEMWWQFRRQDDCANCWNARVPITERITAALHGLQVRLLAMSNPFLVSTQWHINDTVLTTQWMNYCGEQTKHYKAKTVHNTWGRPWWSMLAYSWA